MTISAMHVIGFICGVITVQLIWWRPWRGPWRRYAARRWEHWSVDEKEAYDDLQQAAELLADGGEYLTPGDLAWAKAYHDERGDAWRWARDHRKKWEKRFDQPA